MKKRLFAMLLTLCMVMALLPTAAFAEEAAEPEETVIEVATAEELQTAVNEAEDDTEVTIDLTGDISMDDNTYYYTLTIPENKVILLNLNGYNITSDAESTILIEKGGKLTLNGEGTIENTAESCTATICNYGKFWATAFWNPQGIYYPSVTCTGNNSAVKNWDYAYLYVEEVSGYVDSYGGRITASGIFHQAVRSCIDSESNRKIPGLIFFDKGALEGGITYYGFTAEDIAESVNEEEAFINIYNGTIDGEITAVGNATFEVRGGNFEYPVAEEFLYSYEYEDGSKDEYICIERKDAEDKTYYSVLKKTNRSIWQIRALAYGFWVEDDVVSQDFGSKSAMKNQTVDIFLYGGEAFLTAEELYSVENSTVNGTPVSITYNTQGNPSNGKITLTLEPGENKVEVKSKATDGTEYTFTFALVLDAPAEPAPTPSTPSTSNRPSTSTTPSTPSTGTVTNPDGSTVTTDRDTTGSRSETVVDKNGVQTTDVTVTNAAIRNAAAAGESVALPMPAATATKNSATAPSVTVDLPSGVKTAKVEIPVENVTAGTVAVIVHADGTEEIVPYSIPTEDGIELTVENGATVKIVDNSRDFTDVSTAHTFSDAVDFASARGIVEGYGNGSFGVGSSATSAATVTVIARIMGEDFYGTGATTKAQDWAKENGIAAGLDLSGNVTRGDFMVMLWRAASCPAASASDVNFADASGLSATEQAAFAWAVENGVISGYGDGTVRPDAHITRGAMAAIAQRYMTR